MTTYRYRAYDLVFTASNSWLGRAIRWFTQDPGEGKTEANHVGMITKGGTRATAWLVEALWKVRNHALSRYVGRGQVAVFRPTNLTEQQKAAIAEYLAPLVGAKYGWYKLGFHAYARITGKKKVLKYMFLDKRPICSYLIAKAFSEAGLHFGVEPQAATPDDMMDFCIMNPDKYQIIHGMTEI
jgi:hypothetical protein